MNRVRLQDLALVAVAGGLLAFELVSIGEALPSVKRALADRGRSGKFEIASARAAAVPPPSAGTAASTASPAVAGAVKGHAHPRVAATSPAASKRCVVVTRTADDRHARERRRLVTVTTEVSCATHVVTQSVEKRREMEKAVDLASKQTSL